LRPFFEEFKDLGENQTRVVKVFEKGDFGGLPPDEYAFVELYCDEKNCDCRRVMIMVLGRSQNKILATISMGFDSLEDDAGPFLDPLNQHSKHSRDLLDLFLDVINTDPPYLACLQRRYVMFKERIDRKRYSGAPFETPGEVRRVEIFAAFPSFPRPTAADRGRPKVGRNDPCPCGSGKKFKRCCMLASERGETSAQGPAHAPGCQQASEREAMGDSGKQNTDRLMEDARALVKSVVRRDSMGRKRGRKKIDMNAEEMVRENPLMADALLALLLDEYAPAGAAPHDRHSRLAPRGGAARLGPVHPEGARSACAVRTHASAPARRNLCLPPFDGSGAQGVWSIVGRKRDHRMASVLVKQGIGIRDVMRLDGLSKRDVDDLIDQTANDAMSEKIDFAYMDRVVSHFIWVGQQLGNVPQAGLLRVAEELGCPYWVPRRVVMEDERSSLEGEIDPRLLSSENVSRVLGESRRWPANEPFARSWFEDDSMVDELLAGIGGLSSSPRPRALKTAIGLIFEQVIRPKYDVWAERLLWTTLWAKACLDPTPVPWVRLFIVAREFSRAAPPEDIPLLTTAAEATVFSALARKKA